MRRLLAALMLLVVASFIPPVGIAQTDADARKAAALDYFKKGFEYASRGDHANAVREYRMGLRIDPSNPQGHFYLAESLKEVSGIEGALPHYNQAARLGPNTKEGIKAAAILEVQEETRLKAIADRQAQQLALETKRFADRERMARETQGKRFSSGGSTPTIFQFQFSHDYRNLMITLEASVRSPPGGPFRPFRGSESLTGDQFQVEGRGLSVKTSMVPGYPWAFRFIIFPDHAYYCLGAWDDCPWPSDERNPPRDNWSLLHAR